MDCKFYLVPQIKRISQYFILAIGFLFIGFSLHAKNYYFSSSTGSDSYSGTQAQNQSTPWKSIAKLNAVFSSLAAGDIIYFKKGDVFYGSIIATRSGTASAPILFTSYGTGNRPVISGFTTLSTWTSLGNNIYQATVSAASPSLNLVSINGVPQRIGRYPNFSTTSDPYLYYESFSGAGTSITDTNLTAATNWTGADVVIRKRRWIMDKGRITSQSGGTINYNNPTTYPGLAGFGYFIQNDPRTLDQFGEWYFNTSTKQLQVHFGGGSPSAYTVKVSTIDTLVNFAGYKYLSIKDVAFEGANVAGLMASSGTNIIVQQCDFTQMGKDGLLIRNSPNTLVENVNVNYILNNGINIANTGLSNSNAVVRSCTIKNCGMLPGMGGNGDGTYTGLTMNVNSGATVEFNSIDSSGYDAMEFSGSDVNVRYNLVNHFCCVKDDGGGIYTVGATTTFTNRNVYSNIVLNGIGCSYGSAGKTPEAEGIYMDQATLNVNIYNNSVAHMGRACMLFNNAQNISATGNTLFDARGGAEMARFAFGNTQQVRNITLKKNIIYPISNSQYTVYYENMAQNVPVPITIQADMQAIGTIDSNYYSAMNPAPFCYHSSTDGGITIAAATFSLTDWKTFINKDLASKNPSKSPGSVSDLLFEYNGSATAITIPLDMNYIGVDDTIYNGSITLLPYTSKILIKNGPITTGQSAPALRAAAATPVVNCTGGNTSIAISGTGGTTPYTGTGTFSTNAGAGSLKLSFPTSISNKSTVVYAPVGAIAVGKYYILKFTTIGTTANGSVMLDLRDANSPNALLAPYTTDAFGTARVDHQFIFAPAVASTNGRFEFSVLQSSGTTYIDNVAFFECTSTGDLISSNKFSNGQFESDISGVSIWSSNNNQKATWDNTGKINNINYYTVTDAMGSISTVGVQINQPAVSLKATVTLGGSNILTVAATGGSYPYTGIGSFTGKLGLNSFLVTDANGCSSTASLTLSSLSARTAGGTMITNNLSLSPETPTVLKISSYPNPSTDHFELLVQGGSDERVAVMVMSIDGRILYKTEGSSNKTYEFGDSFMPGLYIVKVTQGNTVQQLKLIKG